jgi:hypothetical protein
MASLMPGAAGHGACDATPARPQLATAATRPHIYALTLNLPSSLVFPFPSQQAGEGPAIPKLPAARRGAAGGPDQGRPVTSVLLPSWHLNNLQVFQTQCEPAGARPYLDLYFQAGACVSLGC